MRVIRREKYPDDDRVGEFDFSELPEMAGAGHIDHATITPNPDDHADIGGLQIGTPTVPVDNTDIVKAQISGGIAGKEYVLNCEATTDLGSVVVLFGRLRILVPPTPPA